MDIGIYKQGQGYWVRVLTAIGAGVLVLACCAWVWAELATVDLPAKGWQVRLDVVDGEVQPGQTIELLERSTVPGEGFIVTGTAAVNDVQLDGRDGNISIGSVQMQGISTPDAIQRVRLPEGGFSGTVAQAGVVAIPIFQRIYLQAGVVGLVMLIGAILVYYFVGVKRSTSEFLIATDGEMKKVNWSTRKEVIGSTWVVIVATFLIAALLFVIDQMFASFFRFINVLES